MNERIDDSSPVPCLVNPDAWKHCVAWSQIPGCNYACFDMCSAVQREACETNGTTELRGTPNAEAETSEGSERRMNERIDGSSPTPYVCSECGWTNVNLLNLGEPGKRRMMCHGCCKRIIEAVDACRAALKPFVSTISMSFDGT